MSRTAPNRRVSNAAAALDHLAVDITVALEHVQFELDRAGVFASDTLAERVSGGGGSSSPVESDTLLAVYELRTRREDIRDWIDGLDAYIASGRHVITETRKLRTGAKEPFDPSQHAQRCSGKVDATCEQWASEQRLPDGTKVNTLCVSCFAKACLVCGNEPAAPRRVDGVRAGEACYKRTLRARVKHAEDAA